MTKFYKRSSCGFAKILFAGQETREHWVLHTWLILLYLGTISSFLNLWKIFSPSFIFIQQQTTPWLWTGHHLVCISTAISLQKLEWIWAEKAAFIREGLVKQSIDVLKRVKNEVYLLVILKEKYILTWKIASYKRTSGRNSQIQKRCEKDI